MHVIHKYEIPIQDEFSLYLQENAMILSFQVQGNEAYIWACHNYSIKEQKRNFVIVGTGHPIENYPQLMFIGTVQLKGLVWHLFEKMEV